MLSEEQKTHVAKELSSAGYDVRIDFPLGPLTTYAVGGMASIAVVVREIESCVGLAKILQGFVSIPVAVIGRGSNTLISDDGFQGLVVVLPSAPREIKILVDNDLVTAHGSMTMPILARQSVTAGRGGLQWCVGVPGSVGGGVRMNAGGHGADMNDSVVSATIVSLISGVVSKVDVKDLGFYFRGSALAPHHIVLSVSFITSEIAIKDGLSTIDEIVRWRRQNQPGGRNAGSVFVNPTNGAQSAGALVDSLGLRGHRVGGASVSEKHANFIQAEPDATAQDIIKVMSFVQSTVEQNMQIRLHSEVCLLGFPQQIIDRFADSLRHEPQRQFARGHLGKLLGEPQ